MRALLLAALALGLAFGAPARADTPPRVLALVTSAEAQVQGMAFVLLNQMRQQGVTGEVMLCGSAADLARREPPSPSPALRPSGATPAQMLQNLIAAGVRAEVCALYLPNAGVGPEALIEGVRPAAPPEMARRMLAASTRVLPF
jgi:predicted peroxiredoxin